MEFVQPAGFWPAQLLPHVRHMVESAPAGDDTQAEVQDLLKALHVSLRTIAKNGQTVSDVRDDQGIDQDG